MRVASPPGPLSTYVERGSFSGGPPSPRMRRGGQGVRWNAAGAVLLCIAGCAKIADPPGGPPDAKPPVLLATRPESAAVYPDFTGNAEFIFDETVSEGSQADMGYGNGDLERLVILSPTEKVPRVGWERSRITVRPREGWRPNTVYRIELLPGVTDLRRNRDKGGQILTFTTGAPFPTDSLSGIVLDWGARQRARQVMVEAVLLPDSLVYRTQTDSGGRFALAPMPHGRYLLRAYTDLNKNRRLDGRENWDSIPVSPAPSASGVLWLAERDTLPPRIASTTFRDSLTIDLQLSQPIDPAQVPDTSNIRIWLLPDSTVVGVASFRTRAEDDTLAAQARARADSIRADSVRRAHPDTSHAAARPAPPTTRDTTPAGRAPQATGRNRAPPVDSTLIKLLATRPTLSDRLVLRVTTAMLPQAKYVVEMRGIRNLNGAAGSAKGGFQVPKPPPPPKVKPDSLRADSTGHDSTGAPVRRPNFRPRTP